MKKSITTILQYLFFLGIGGLFVWLSVKDISKNDWLEMKDAIGRAKHWLIIPAVILLFLSHYVRALRWKILMEPMGYHPSKFNTFAAVMIGYLVNTGVPRLGEVVKCTILTRYEKVRADRLVGTIVMERAVDVVCLAIVFIVALLTQWNVIGNPVINKFQNFFQDKTGGTSVTKIALVIGAVVLFFSMLYFFLKRFAHINAVGKIKEAIKGVLQGLNSIRLIKRKGLFFFHTILIWFLYLLNTTIGIWAIQETAHLGWAGGVTTLAIGSVGMIITPGGIGAYPYLVANLISYYGLPEKPIGVALGWLLWAVQTLIVLVGGLIFFALLSYYNKNKHATRKQHTEQNIDIA
jgi:glycosyltransferase 2 family protein